MKWNKMIKTLVPFVFFFVLTNAFAQDADEAPDDTDEEDALLNPAPISDYIIPMLIIGVATAFILLKKKTPEKVS